VNREAQPWRASTRQKSIAPFGGHRRRGAGPPLRGEGQQGFTGGPDRPEPSSSIFEFSGKKTRKYRKIWRSTYELFFIRSSEKNSCDSQKKIFFASRKIFFRKNKIFFCFFKIFSKKIEKIAKNTKKWVFSKSAPWREFRVSGAVFLWKGGTLSIYLGGGVTPIFRSILRIRTPFFGGLFLTLFFEFFLEKKIFFGQKIFFETKKN
jgi:hypothetical protein